MVEINIAYGGDLHTRAVHGPSGSVIETDAPKDNQGKGEAFSPTDLLATSLGTCMLTLMGIIARRENVSLGATTVRVTKEMSATPPRRVARLVLEFTLPSDIASDQRPRLEAAAHTCPVQKSLHPDIEVVTRFAYA